MFTKLEVNKMGEFKSHQLSESHLSKYFNESHNQLEHNTQVLQAETAVNFTAPGFSNLCFHPAV